MADKLFSPMQLNSFSLKNRIGVAPMTRLSAGQKSIPRQDVFDFLITRAQNGATIVYSEAIVTDYESSQGGVGSIFGQLVSRTRSAEPLANQYLKL